MIDCPAIIAARTTVHGMSFREGVDMFKPLVSKYIPMFEQVVSRAFMTGSLHGDGKVYGFYNTGIMDCYLEMHNMEWLDAASEELYAVAEVFMETHDLYYYGRCNSDFNTYEATNLAQAAGKRGTVMDNLS
jgi:hypothetical protein